MDVAALVEYPDHHWFVETDLEELARHAAVVGADGLITTEKDWVRLRELRLPTLFLAVLLVELHLDAGGEPLLLQILERTLTAAARR